MRLLDLACRYGRHADRLAAPGHDVIRVDITPGFIEMHETMPENCIPM